MNIESYLGNVSLRANSFIYLLKDVVALVSGAKDQQEFEDLYIEIFERGYVRGTRRFLKFSLKLIEKKYGGGSSEYKEFKKIHDEVCENNKKRNEVIHQSIYIDGKIILVRSDGGMAIVDGFITEEYLVSIIDKYKALYNDLHAFRKGIMINRRIDYL